MESNKLAPIILFVYNRPFHTEKVLASLQRNSLAEKSTLIVYSDGPKPGTGIAEIEQIQAIRNVVNSKKWCGNTKLIARESNMGLANSIITGVSETVAMHGKVIVLEDDTIVNEHFLTYMNAALDYYADNDSVASIQGYTYPIKNFPEYFFLKGADCWGWGTWQRAWKYFEPNGQLLLDALKSKGMENDFNYYGSINYTGMLKDQVDEKINSWAIRWQASTYLRGMVSLYPGRSFVKNIGFDGSGVHSGNLDVYNDNSKNTFSLSLNFKNEPVIESLAAKNLISNWLRSIHHPPFFRKLVLKIISVLKRIKSRISS